jgi:hypothetical protein
MFKKIPENNPELPTSKVNTMNTNHLDFQVESVDNERETHDRDTPGYGLVKMCCKSSCPCLVTTVER